MKRYILTGTPGSGKTSIIHTLKSQGYFVVEEAATDIITLEQANGDLMPGHNRSSLIKLYVCKKRDKWKQMYLLTNCNFMTVHPFVRMP